MVPEPGKRPNFSQIYIYDREKELENQLQNFSTLDCTLLQELQEMTKEVNPCAQEYCHVGDIIRQNPTLNVKLVLKAKVDNIDPHRYNLPTGTDTAIIMPTDSN